MSLYLKATRDLFARYLQIFKATWRVRHQLDPVPRHQHELAFLPARLELSEAPVHPAPRWAMRCLVAFAIITTLWALFGRLDIVVMANGKLVPSARVKLVQPLDDAIVRAILVQDGQRVRAGQPLVELDSTEAGADLGIALSARLDAAVMAARAQSLLTALQQGRSPVVDAVGLQAIAGSETLPPVADAQRHADGLYREFQAQLATLRAGLAQREAELETVQRQIDKLSQTAPLARQSADSYRKLAQDKYVSQQAYLDREQIRIEQEQELAAQRSRLQETRAAIQTQQRQIEATTAQFRREQLDTLTQAQTQLARLQQQASKARQRQDRQTLLAPIDGTVQQLAVHTVGGVVTQAQTLMTVVPDDTLEVDALVENKDIGFVGPDQVATIKVQAFPYTRYGTISGKVTQVSNDAMQDKDNLLTFPMKVSLQKSRMQIENKLVNLTPGMAVTVEVKTGTRTVGEYFLSPLVQYAQESLRER